MSKKPKTPPPDYKEMARKYSTWRAEDKAIYEESLKDINNRHNKDLSSATARYAASGGSPDRISGIKKEYEQKLSESMAGLEKTKKDMATSLETGYTGKTLRKRFQQQESNKLYTKAAEAFDRQVRRANDDRAGNQQRALRNFKKQWGATGVTVSKNDDGYRVNVSSKDYPIEPEAFDKWLYGLSGIDPNVTKSSATQPEQQSKPKEGGIKLRKGERRGPMMSTQIQVNPWVQEI